MPVAKKRADLAELISVAAVQRTRIAKRQRRHSIIRIKRAISNESTSGRIALKDKVRNLVTLLSQAESIPHNGSESTKDDTTEQSKGAEASGSNECILYVSAHIHWFLELLAVRILRLFVILLAFLTLSYEASDHRGSCASSVICRTVDISIDIFFIVEGALKFFAFYAHMDMNKVLTFETVLRRSGLSDMGIAMGSVVFARNQAGDWFRLIRVLLISSFAVEEMPHLEVLLVSIPTL